jgi:branched-chain amino acid transport system permease protein
LAAAPEHETKAGMKAKLAALCVAALAIAAPFLGIPGWSLSLATTAAFTALALLGLNLIFGVAGMLAFGQAALMAAPAYVAGILMRLGTPVPVALPAGLLAALLAAWLVALIFVRLPGVFLAVGTLGLGFVVEGLARAFPDVTGGASGLVLPLGRALPALTWYAIAVVALLAGLVAYAALVRGANQRRLRTICHDELMAAAMGIDVARAKTIAFTQGSGFAVVAGLLLAFYVGVIVPENAGVETSLEQIGTVMLGGPGFLVGPVIGAAIVGWLFFAAGWAARFELLIYGAVFLAAVLWAREGIAGWLVGPWSRLRLAEAPVPPCAAPAVMRQVQGPCLEVSGLSKRFGGVQALADVTFSVDAGEIFTLVGPNGAGKSTLFNLISGLLPPSAGTIRVDGLDVGDLPVHRRAALIGRSFQVARLVPALTAAENLAVRLDHLPGAPPTERARMAAVRAQLDDFGLLHLADRPIGTLSVGQHKLIDLARAALLAPPLVLLDEPAVGLEQSELDHLEELLGRLQRGGSAVVIVEHNIDFVARVAARGLVLDSGRPIALGPIQDILTDARVHEAYFGVLA